MYVCQSLVSPRSTRSGAISPFADIRYSTFRPGPATNRTSGGGLLLEPHFVTLLKVISHSHTLMRTLQPQQSLRNASFYPTSTTSSTTSTKALSEHGVVIVTIEDYVLACPLADNNKATPITTSLLLDAGKNTAMDFVMLARELL